MTIALFGGAFDPPHLGHQQVVSTLIDNWIVDQVWYVPVNRHPFSKKMLAIRHRVAMLKLIKRNSVRVELYETKQTGISYTYDTLDYLANKYPQHKFCWVIGSDNLKDFHKWDDSRGLGYEEMLSKYRFYVYARSGYELEPLYPGMVSLTEVKEVVVSSTEIKEKVKAGQPISNLVDPKVEVYIREHQLYK